jgi:hypothetical protein
MALLTPSREIRARTGALTRAGRDVRLQRRYDNRRKFGWDHFHARVRAVEEAQAAVRERERGAQFALRQALIDLASCCEHMAIPMTPPNVVLEARGPESL